MSAETCDLGEFRVLSAHMAITSSAKKANRVAKRRRVFNLRRKATLAAATKSFKKALVAGDITRAQKLLPAAQKAIDKAEKRGVLKGNTANRKKARLAASIRRAQA